MSSNLCLSNSDSLQIFALNGGQSFGLPLEMDRATNMLDLQVYQFNEQLLDDLSKIARERIQKLQIFKRQTDYPFREQKLQVSRFLRLVLGNTTCLKGEAISESMMLVLGALPELDDPLLKNGWTSVWDKKIYGYQVYHGVLEWRWLIMLILKDVKECTTTDEEFMYQVFDKKSVKSFRTIYGEMMADMLNIAYHLFQLYGVEKISTRTPYTCHCTKLMWVGMLVLSDIKRNEVDFWICLNENMPSKVNESSDGYLFKIWIVNTLAKLYVLKPTLKDEKFSVTLLSGYNAVDDIVKKFLESAIIEKQVRKFIILLNPIISVLWPERFETVIAVWNYFCFRLNSCFITQSDSITDMSCVSHSIDEFIEQAASLAAMEAIQDDINLQKNSFHMFLVMLSKLIRHCTTQALNRKVQIIFNRIFLKLGPNKFENMTEQAIYNLGLMLLTMASATSFEIDHPRLSKIIQMIPLISGNLPIDVTINRIVVAAQAHMALLVFFSGSNFDKSTHIASFLQSIDIPYRKYGKRMQPVLKVIAEGMHLIYNKASIKNSFNRGEKHFIGSWILAYLRNRSSESERQKQKLLEAILASFNCKDAALDDGYWNAIDQYVMPFVKEKFSNKVASPCIARIASRMTIHKSLSSSFKKPSLFLSYINCPEACPEQVLVYLKDLTQNQKMLSLMEDRIIIEQWLKMGIYFDRQRLLDLTRVVYGLEEFKALCEIPEEDMFANKAIPIRLFFLDVAKRYKASDADTQKEMKKKMHGILQNIDIWIRNPIGIIRKRILAVIILALRECPELYYMQSSSSCLFHLAFQHFFLPFSVPDNGDVQYDLIEDMANIWDDVMDIIGKMDYCDNEIIQDYAYNMMSRWIPHFAKLKNSNDALKPLIQFFCGHNEELVLYTMPRFVMMFLDLRRCLPKPNALPVMQLLKKLIETLVNRNNVEKIALFVRTMGLSLTQHAFMCNERQLTRAIALEIVFDLLNSTEGPSNLVTLEMRSVLVSFTHKYFPLSAECYTNFMCRLFDHNPNFIRSMIDEIRCELVQVEIACGQEQDDILLKALERLDNVFKHIE